MGVMKRLATARSLGLALPIPLHKIPLATPPEFQPGQAVEWFYDWGEIIPATVLSAGAEKVTVLADWGHGHKTRCVVDRSELTPVAAGPKPAPQPAKPTPKESKPKQLTLWE